MRAKLEMLPRYHRSNGSCAETIKEVATMCDVLSTGVVVSCKTSAATVATSPRRGMALTT